MQHLPCRVCSPQRQFSGRMPSACLSRYCCFSRSGRNSTTACTRDRDSRCLPSRLSPSTAVSVPSCQSPLLKTASDNSQKTRRGVLNRLCSYSFCVARRFGLVLAAIRTGVSLLYLPSDRHLVALCEWIGRVRAHLEHSTFLVLYFTFKCGSHDGMVAAFVRI